MDPVSKAQSEKPPKSSGNRGTLANLRPWKPGQSGNPSGRPKRKPITEIFEAVLAKGVNRKEIENTVLEIVTAGRMASVLMLREMAERVEGKVTQPVEVSGQITDLSDEELKERLAKLLSKD